MDQMMYNIAPLHLYQLHLLVITSYGENRQLYQQILSKHFGIRPVIY